MVCFADLLATSREKLKSGRPLLFSVNVEKEAEDMLRMNLQTVSFLDEMASKTVPGIKISFTDANCIEQLKDVLAEADPGHTQITLFALLQNWEVPIELKERYTLTTECLGKIRKIAGIREVEEF